MSCAKFAYLQNLCFYAKVLRQNFTESVKENNSVYKHEKHRNLDNCTNICKNLQFLFNTNEFIQKIIDRTQKVNYPIIVGNFKCNIFIWTHQFRSYLQITRNYFQIFFVSNFNIRKTVNFTREYYMKIVWVLFFKENNVIYNPNLNYRRESK